VLKSAIGQPYSITSSAQAVPPVRCRYRFNAAQVAGDRLSAAGTLGYPAKIRLGVMASFSHAMSWEATYVAA
jgi:hypothetical protein